MKLNPYLVATVNAAAVLIAAVDLLVMPVSITRSALVVLLIINSAFLPSSIRKCMRSNV